MDQDKQADASHYDAVARSLLAEGSAGIGIIPVLGSTEISPSFRAPYTYYEQCIRHYVLEGQDVLELGSGMGLHTYALAKTGARVVASDISLHALEVLSRRIAGVTVQVADMEYLPFGDNSFDAVTCAGSLSYGAAELVDAEVRRVLRPGGVFICVDSLNHNPVYRFNRWIQCLRGTRTNSTVLRMPTIGRIQSIARGFMSAEVSYFGAVSYLMPVLSRVVGQERAAAMSDACDRLFDVRRAAFKFVLVARGVCDASPPGRSCRDDGRISLAARSRIGC